MVNTAVGKQPVKKSKGMRRSFSDKLISVITYVVYALFAFVCVYPFYYIFINSISANNLSDRGKVILYPMEIHFENYVSVAKIPGLLTAAQVSLARTIIGTILTVIVAAFLGYMFTRDTLWKRKVWYRFVAATMYFNAGVIPWYLTMKTIGLTNNFWGYILPMIALGGYSVSFLARLMRSSLLEVMGQDYIRTARAKGVSGTKVIFGHALKNALIPVITYCGPMLAYIVTGSLVVEQIFAVNGIGRAFVSSITDRDYPMIMGTTIILATLIVVMNLISDILYKIVDPRINLE